MEDVKKLRPGTYILHKDRPWRVLKNQIVVTGTHSHTKNKLELQNVFSGDYESITLPPHDKVEDIQIIRKLGQLLSKAKEKVQVMDMNTYETFDAEISQELFENLNEGDNVTFIEFNGRISILEKRLVQ